MKLFFLIYWKTLLGYMNETCEVSKLHSANNLDHTENNKESYDKT